MTSPEGDARRQAVADAGPNLLDMMTLSQALDWIDANVTNLATAIVALKHVVRYLFIVERRLDELEAQSKGKD
jgi:hypothetical protein